MKELYQLRFRGAGAVPDARTLERWARRWVNTGRRPKGVQIDVKDWYSPKLSQDKLRFVLRRGGVFFGCPGIVASYWSPFTTMCDYDTSEPPDSERFYAMAHFLQRSIEWLSYFRSRRGWHVVIRWNRKLKPIEAVAIQAILGSDPVRERFNIARVMGPDKGKDPRWNLLFERKIRE